MFGLEGFGLEAHGLGLAACGLGLATQGLSLGLELETQALSRDM